MSAEDDTTQPVSIGGAHRVAKASGDIYDEQSPFLVIGSWLPPAPLHKRNQLPQPTDRGQGTAMHAETSRSFPLETLEQPGLIPVETELELVRFASPFTGLPYEGSAPYPHICTANQHWQPFRAGPQPEHYSLSQVDSPKLQRLSSSRPHGYSKLTGAPIPHHESGSDGGGQLGPSVNIWSEPTTPGYSLVTIEETTWYSNSEAEHDTQRIITALSSSDPDTEDLINILSRHSHPFDIASRKLAYRRKFSTPKARELLDVVEAASRHFSSGFHSLLRALIAGPLELDAHILFRAMVGAGTNEEYLRLVLLGRTNHEIKAIAAQYEAVSRKRAMVAGKETETLRSALEGDVRGNLRKLYFGILLAARRWEDPGTPIPHVELQGDILDLSAALTGELDVDKVLKYFVSASYHRLASISNKWKDISGDTETLEERIEERFHRDLEDTLLYILSSARDRAMRDAMTVEEIVTKSGFRLGKSGKFPLRNIKQEELAIVVVKLVWQDQILEGRTKPNGNGGIYKRGTYLREVDATYVTLLRSNSEQAVRGDLLLKIQEETSGEFSKFLVELWRQRENPEA
ncbi:Annexin [Terfezia boudieri ATCC MYA-4762]|uniref:Annexin n=1 Tax=Terfezia boudieri ATCC MYA-4762 TaxID=1051890 RepID=A0A3N4LUT8_9PEZI|nr:Annexin [Terfezia boudieri ATCC MYA-4762]